MESQTSKIISGIIISNVLAVIIVGITKFLTPRAGYSDVIIFSVFFIVPFLMGIFNGWQWHDMKMRAVEVIGWCIVSTLLSVVLSAIYLGEGTICLFIVSPIILAMMVAGTFIGREVYRRRNNTLKSSLFGILALFFVADVIADHESLERVSDTLMINAPVEKVWPYVVEYEPITLKENYWLFRAGMPSPVQSTVDGHEAGAGRKCIFSNGYVFDEKMVVYKPNEELTFDIISQPRDPEIMGHIDITRGQFILKDNGDGTTTLIGNSWYKLYVFPSWYFNLWSESITRNVHLRVMDHIKILSEKDV